MCLGQLQMLQLRHYRLLHLPLHCLTHCLVEEALCTGCLQLSGDPCLPCECAAGACDPLTAQTKQKECVNGFEWNQPWATMKPINEPRTVSLIT
jgi:hypothetical protein